jgi:purine-nucleoside phosphorylase
MGMRVAAVSVITDHCDPDHLEPANIEDIIHNAMQAEKDLVFLFETLIREL